MAKTITVDLELKYKEAVKNLDEFQKEYSKLEKQVESTNKDLKDQKDGLNDLTTAADRFTGGAVSGLKGVAKTAKSAALGFRTLGGAIAATGIGALVIAIVSLTQAFTRSEEGQNKFAKILGVIGSVVGNVLDLVADFGETIINAFTNPKQALIDFKEAFVQNIINRFKAALETVGFLGSAIKNVFSGEFSKALEDAKNATKSFVDVYTGVPNSVDKAANAVKKFADEVKKDALSAADIADKRAEADRKARELVVERAEAERKIAELREKAADKERYTAAERIKFLEDAGAQAEKIALKETEIAQLRFSAKEAENALAKSTKEDLDEQAQLQAEVIAKETERLRIQKALTAELTTTRREAAAQEKADQAVKDAEELERTKELEALKLGIRDAVALSQAEKDALEIQKTQEKYDALISAAKKYGLDTVALEQAKEQAVSDLKANFAEKNATNQIKWEELTQSQKANIIAGGFNNLATILGKESAAGKAAAIAAATISTYQSATESYKSLAGIPIIGPTLGFAAAGAAIAGGIANVRQILATKTPKVAGVSTPSGGGGSVPSGGGGAASSAPPSFNIVGAGATNSLAEAIGSQEQKPVKAYVTTNDVTTGQALDRNIVQGASIG